jgi:hypothetical protein
MNDIASWLRAQIPSSTDPGRLERLAREAERQAVSRSGIATFVKERTQVGRRPESQTTALAGPSPQPIKDRAVDMRKTVDVFVQDRLVASYPVVAMAIDRPTDDDFIERIKQQMRHYYRSEDIEAARFVVRGAQTMPASIEGKKLIRH